MSKLPQEKKFLDVSDYGRPIAISIANSLKNTSYTPIHVTCAFVVSGLIAIACLLHNFYVATLFFLVLKSILDAADGELARVKKTPSYTGRYLDSISDIVLNFMLFAAIAHITNATLISAFLAFFCMQLQGTLYNYYYVILRNKYHGDTTSRVFENEAPKALSGEKQSTVNLLFGIYYFCYGLFDKIIYQLDKTAVEQYHLPNWFMTAVSTFGLGFQLLLIGFLLVLQLKQFIIPFFIGYSFLIVVFIWVRNIINR